MKNYKEKPEFSYKYQKPSYQLPKSNWINRNPRLFSILFITGSLSIFFSRQIYDIFIRKDEDFFQQASRIPPNRR